MSLGKSYWLDIYPQFISHRTFSRSKTTEGSGICNDILHVILHFILLLWDFSACISEWTYTWDVRVNIFYEIIGMELWSWRVLLCLGSVLSVMSSCIPRDDCCGLVLSCWMSWTLQSTDKVWSYKHELWRADLNAELWPFRPTSWGGTSNLTSFF